MAYDKLQDFKVETAFTRTTTQLRFRRTNVAAHSLCCDDASATAHKEKQGHWLPSCNISDSQSHYLDTYKTPKKCLMLSLRSTLDLLLTN
jgi:hypothetical protein